MGKTTKLIRWQRITIGILFLSLCIMSLLAHGYRYSGDRDHTAAEFYQFSYLQRGETLRDKQRIIDDLDEKVSKYELKYGPLEPYRRKGEGVYIGRHITRGVPPSR